MNLKDKKVLVCGFGRTGLAVVNFLLKADETVGITIFTENEIDNKVEFDEERVNYFVAKNPNDIISRYNLIVVSPGISTSERFFEIAKDQNIEFISEIELANRFFKGVLVGITGTNGKTTTTMLVNEILKLYGDSRCVGNIGIPFAQEVLNISSDAYAVAELSSYQLETTYTIKPKVSTILNITNDHLVRHKTLDNYIDAKKRIFMNQDSGDYVALNYDDEKVRTFAADTKAKVVYFSRLHDISDKYGVFVKEGGIYSNISGTLEKIMNISDIKLIGAHNVENVLAAIAMTQVLGVDIIAISTAIREFKGAPHRIEYVKTINGISFYNDSKATNVESAIMAIKAITAPLILIVGGDDKNLPLYDLVKYAQDRARKVIIIGSSTKNFVECFKKIGYNDYIIESTLQSAVLKAYEVAETGDCVLLSPGCASFDMFRDFEDRGNVFKETVLSIRG